MSLIISPAPMKAKLYLAIINVSLMLLILMLPINAKAGSGERILESINVIEEQEVSIIDIKLNQQLIFSSYTPLKGGDRLIVKVKRTDSALKLSDEQTNFETLPWKPTEKIPLYQVTVDFNDDEVTLDFNRQVNFKVRGGVNAFHLFVEVLHATDEPENQQKLMNAPVVLNINQHAIKGKKNLEIEQIMEDARIAIIEKDYSRAVQLYTKVVLDESNSIYAQDALEYLGLARERKGQLGTCTK